MEKILILFGSTGGNTEEVANTIASKIDGDVTVEDVADVAADIAADYNNIILGTSTWGVGELQDDWDEFLPNLVKEDFSGKNVALFGLGDSMGNSETFTDAMSIIGEEMKKTNCNLLEGVSTDGYEFDESQSVVNNKFIGLALDEDNQSDLTEERIDAWLEMILPQFK